MPPLETIRRPALTTHSFSGSTTNQGHNGPKLPAIALPTGSYSPTDVEKILDTAHVLRGRETRHATPFQATGTWDAQEAQRVLDGRMEVEGLPVNLVEAAIKMIRPEAAAVQAVMAELGIKPTFQGYRANRVQAIQNILEHLIHTSPALSGENPYRLKIAHEETSSYEDQRSTFIRSKIETGETCLTRLPEAPSERTSEPFWQIWRQNWFRNLFGLESLIPPTTPPAAPLITVVLHAGYEYKLKKLSLVDPSSDSDPGNIVLSDRFESTIEVIFHDVTLFMAGARDFENMLRAQGITDAKVTIKTDFTNLTPAV